MTHAWQQCNPGCYCSGKYLLGPVVIAHKMQWFHTTVPVVGYVTIPFASGTVNHRNNGIFRWLTGELRVSPTQLCWRYHSLPLKQWFVFVLATVQVLKMTTFGALSDIKNNAWVTVNNDFWVTSEAICQWFSRFVTSENPWQITSRVTPKSLFTVTNVSFYFLHAIWCPEHTILLKELSIADFAIVAKDSLFWFSIVTSPQLICDVTRM